MKKVLLVKYGEIALRKGNRGMFERRLAETIQRMANEPGEKLIKCSREQGRLLIEDSRGDIDTEYVIEKIRRIFGVSAICVALKLDDRELKSLKDAALILAKECEINDTGNLNESKSRNETNNLSESGSHKSFKIETKRSDKNHPLLSQEISSAVGEYVLENTSMIVNVRQPDYIIWLEIRNHAYAFYQTIKSESGLPYGSTGRGVLLLSGGIDSPVAGYLMAKRGMEIVPIYFHSPPHTSERAKEKVIDICESLGRYLGTINLYVVNFTAVQMYISDNMPHAKLTLFLKRAMLHIASAIAEKEKAHCLITGDSIGQVASQTAQAIAAVDNAANLPVLRPLAAMDKQQIIDIAKIIDTFEISIRPYEDCCTIFVPKHPEHKPSSKAVSGIEARHWDRLSPLLEEAVKTIEQVSIN